MQTTRFDVALASDMCVDLILAGNVRPRFGQVEQLIDNYELELGGSANIFACQLAKLGARVAVIGKIGSDSFGDLALERLKECRVDCSLVQADKDLRTGLGVTLAEPEDRAILTYLGGMAALLADDLPQDPAAICRHWHIAGFFLMKQLRPAWGQLLREAKRGGITTSLDTNWDPENRWEGVHELLPFVDVFLPNASEAAALTGENDTVAASRALSETGPLVVTKRGEQGAIAVRRDKIWEFKPPENVICPVDTVGAGDNFDAGFIRAWMSGLTIEKCLQLGHRCAVASLLAFGGIQGQLLAPSGEV